MSALLIDAAAAEWQKHRKSWKRALKLVYVDESYFYTVFFCSLTKVWGRKGGVGLQCWGTTFVMLNPILNLPVLISHHKHPFTKQRIVAESGIGGLGGGQKQHKALPNGRHWIKPKPASPSLRRKKNRKPRIMLPLSSTASTRHKHKGENNRQSKTELKRKINK